jgi:Cysteine rich repeat
MKEKVRMISRLLLAAVLVGASTLALAQSSGTPDEQDKCRRDVRRFCHSVESDAGDSAFLQCLELHRDDLSED